MGDCLDYLPTEAEPGENCIGNSVILVKIASLSVRSSDSEHLAGPVEELHPVAQ